MEETNAAVKPEEPTKQQDASVENSLIKEK